MFKALGNFNCNGIKKEVGDEISIIEEDEIKDFIDSLLKEGLIEEIVLESKPISKKKKVRKKVK